MEYVHEIERLIREIEETADPGTREGVRRLVEAILGYHEKAVSRVVELAGEQTLRALARDELTASLLLLYGLHPDDFETRVKRAVDRIPGVELLDIDNFTVRLKGDAPRQLVEQALYEAAPEIAGIEMEGAAAFVPLEALLGR